MIPSPVAVRAVLLGAKEQFYVQKIPYFVNENELFVHPLALLYTF
jgi:hypothetical protein